MVHWVSVGDCMGDCDALHSGHRRSREDPGMCECTYFFTYQRCWEHGASRRRRPVVKAANLAVPPESWKDLPKRTLAHCSRCGREDVTHSLRGMCLDCRRQVARMGLA